MIKLLLALIPGGPLLGAIGSLLSGILSFVGWCFEWVLRDIGDAFREPQKGVVRIICGLILLGVGAVSGMHYQERTDAAQIASLTREVKQWRQRYADQEKRAAEADAARKAAEAKVLEGGVAAQSAAVRPISSPSAKRVRHTGPAAAKASGPGLFSVPTYRR